MGKNIFKLLVLSICLLIISIPVFIIYKIFFTEVVTKNFITTGTIVEMEYEEGKWETKEVTSNVKQEDGTIKKVKEKKKVYDSKEWDLQINYTDSQGSEHTFKEEPVSKSDLYISLENEHLKAGDNVDLIIEERFLNGKLSSTKILKINK